MNDNNWDDYEESQLQADAEEAYLAQLPTNLHEDAVRSYLGSYGDAIDARITSLLSDAKSLSANKFPGPSVVVSATTIEVMIRYFCVRPIFESAFLSDLIAREVTEKITRSRRFPERDLLAGILRPWGIELKDILLNGGNPLWKEFTTIVIESRNNFVHRGEDVRDRVASTAIECVTTFREKVVMVMARRLGFTHDQSGCWSKVITDPKDRLLFGGKVINGETSYVPRNPFA